MNAIKVNNVTANIEHCYVCDAPLVIVDGKLVGEVTFWAKDGKPSVTAHRETCEFKGKELP